MSSCQSQPVDLTLRTQTQDATTVLHVVGQMLGPSAHQVRIALLELLETRPKRLVADLSDASDLDTLGVGALLAASLWARHKAVPFVVLPSPIIHGALTKANVTGYLSLTEPV